MTLLIASILPDGAYLSADTLVVGGADPCSPGTTSDPAVAAQSAYPGGGGPETARVIGWCDKLILVPRLGMVAGCAGSLLAARAFYAHLSLGLGAVDMADFAVLAGGALARVLAEAGAAEAVCIAAGWSRREDRLVAVALNARPRCAALRELASGTHSMIPSYDPDGLHAGEIAARWEAAGRGVETERFHELLALNIHDAFTRGRTRPGAAFGGELITARVKRSGISAWRAAAFPALVLGRPDTGSDQNGEAASTYLCNAG